MKDQSEQNVQSGLGTTSYHITDHHTKVDDAQYIHNTLPTTIYPIEDVGAHPDYQRIFTTLQGTSYALLPTAAE